MRGNTPTNDERGQAYTLEGFIGAMIVLMALLFALQSVVITPTTGGLADRTVQDQIQQEAQDALLVSTHDGDLSETIRYWDGNSGFEGATDPSAPGEDHNTYSVSEFNESTLGGVLEERFADRGWSYNVELHYEDEGHGPANSSLVYQGSPPSDAVTASYTVALYDNQTVTSDPDDNNIGEETLEGAEDDYEVPIPRVKDDPQLYNVVEVRVIVW
ncbi:hypothetical protein G6M89_00690 [Natronolimnobius sp. AArcel1]|uniref:DUF7288 family protein n=1 Tax=Natronolimnobius sp. AArcel1 TaxID=1679093 RepID=UPI0013EA9E64|nr:hypothetical protein [Natronolimnobius sp. AArcel1]NGM67536.1 hypothetical protein [Natronolimnobius sp. AArcel1]